MSSNEGGAFDDQTPDSTEQAWASPSGGWQPPAQWAPPSVGTGGAPAEATPTRGHAGRYRPLTLADVLDGMFRLFLTNWRSYALAIGIAVVPLSIVTAWLNDRTGLNTGFLEQLNNPATSEAVFQAGPQQQALIALIAVQLVTSLVVAPFWTGAACRIAGEAYEGRDPQPGAVLRWTLRRYLALAGATWLMAVVVVAILVPPSGLIAAAVLTSEAGLGVLGGVVLVFASLPLMVWVLTRFALAYPAIVMERVGPVAALRRSAALVNGRWWRTFGTLLLAGLIGGIVTQVVSAPFSVPAAIFGGITGSVLIALGTIVAAVVGTPLNANARTLLYFDGRVRSEGYDLELMTREVVGHHHPGEPGQPFG